MSPRQTGWRAMCLALCVIALPACGWVDAGVGSGNPVTDREPGMYSVGVGETLVVDAEEGVLRNETERRRATARVVTAPSHAAAFEFNPDGSFTYTHDGSASIRDVFEYVASDGTHESPPTAVTIDITHPPVAADDGPYRINRGETLAVSAAEGLLANDTDLDTPDALSVRLESEPQDGTLTLQEDGSFTYAHGGGEANSDSFTYRASDGVYESAPATVRIAINARPLARNDGPYALVAGTTLVVDAPGVLGNDTDPDGDALHAVLETPPTHGELDLREDGGFIYRPRGDALEDVFTYRAHDGLIASEPAQVLIAIAPPNRPPVLVSSIPDQSATVGQPFTLELAPHFSDPDGDALSYAVQGLPPGLGLTGTRIEGTPTQTGSSTVQVTARDPAGLSVSDSFVLQVTAANRPPELVASIPDQSATVGQAFALELASYFSDPDGDALTYTASGLPAGLTLSGSRIAGTPTEAGSSNVQVTARDPAGASVSDSFVLQVTAANRPPVLTSSIPDQSATVGQPFALELAPYFSDPDGDALTYTASGLPDGLTLSGSRIAGTPTEAGSYTVQVTAQDPAGASVSDDFVLSVQAAAEPPAAMDDSYTLTQGSTLQVDAASGVLANDSDPAGGSLTVSSFTQPAKGSVALEPDGSFAYEYTGQNGMDEDAFSYVAYNGSLESDPATVTIRIDRGDDDDDIGDDQESGATDDYYISLTAQVLEVEADEGVLANDAPAPTTQTASLTFAAYSLGATAEPVETGESGALHYNGLQAQLVTGPAHGSLALGPDGSFTYTHDGEAVARDSFTYLSLDASGATSMATVTISLIESLAAPAHCWSTPQDTALAGVRLGEEGGARRLSYALLTEGRLGHAAVVDATTGEFEYRPYPSAGRGLDTLIYRVEDPQGEVAAGTVSVLVVPRIMPLGDALTVGLTDGADDTAGGYRAPLQAALAAEGFAVDFVGSQGAAPASAEFDPDHEGHAGWGPAEIAYGRRGDGTDGVYAWLERNPADLVLLQFGSAAAADPVGLEAVLEEIARWEADPGGNPVTVLLGRLIDSLPADAEVTRVNAGLEAMLRGRSAPRVIVIDQQAVLWDAQGQPDPAYYADGRHPNAAGYARMAGAWVEALTELLPRCSPPAP